MIEIQNTSLKILIEDFDSNSFQTAEGSNKNIVFYSLEKEVRE